MLNLKGKNGVDDGDRTHDHRNHNPALYQLSYAHHLTDKPGVSVDNTGLEIGRGREIRTPDILLPKQARYQTALYPENQIHCLYKTMNFKLRLL